MKILTKNWDLEPLDLAAYKKRGGYMALAKALRMKPESVIDEVKKSGIRGRGGAGFQAGVKWQIARDQECSKRYFICNLDESEPGTYKDRFLAEKSPFSLLEGLAIGAYAVGADQAYIYINGNFSTARERLARAIEIVREHHFLGEGLMGSSFDLEVELVVGAGAYICGEESALINSIEGGRGEPRRRPPFACACGLFNKPTVVNNAETISNLPWIINNGGEKFSKIGSPKNPGTKLFCIEGSVKKPGIYEIETGASVHELIFGQASGLSPSKEYYFAQIGGASGQLVPMGLWDEEIGYGPDFKIAMGSGSVLVVDKSIDIKGLVLSWARFFARESCGQCAPCREGTFRVKEILERLVSGDFGVSDKEDLADLIYALDNTTFCALGKFSVNALKDVIRFGFISELADIKIHEIRSFQD